MKRDLPTALTLGGALLLALFLALPMALLGALTSGTRFPIVTAGVTLLVLGVLKRPQLLTRMAIMMALLALPLTLMYPKAMGNAFEFIDTHILGADSWKSRFGEIDRTVGELSERDVWLTGYGTGALSIGVQYLYSGNGEQAAPGSETGPTAVISAYGFTGLPLWYWLTLAMTVTAIANYRRQRGSPTALYSFVIALLAFNHLILHNAIAPQGVENYISSFFMWLSLGISMKFARLYGKSARTVPVSAHSPPVRG